MKTVLFITVGEIFLEIVFHKSLYCTLSEQKRWSRNIMEKNSVYQTNIQQCKIYGCYDLLIFYFILNTRYLRNKAKMLFNIQVGLICRMLFPRIERNDYFAVTVLVCVVFWWGFFGLFVDSFVVCCRVICIPLSITKTFLKVHNLFSELTPLSMRKNNLD